jgi:calcium-dependent protein kinase
MGMNADKDEVR